MSRASWLLIIALLSWSDSSWALKASDTMSAWKAASAQQKRKLATDILKREAPPGVIKCLDAASEVAGHADLPIVQVVKACDENGSQPV